MIYLTIEFWKVVLDIIGLSLCGITILHLMKNKSKYNQSLLKESGKRNSGSFNEEVLAQLEKQESDMPFETISDAIESAKKTGQVQEGSYNKKSSGSDDLAGDEYDEVARLADLGLSVKKISERAKIPKREVELVVKLKGLE
ncbi:MAG: hypothetical protein LWW98_00185, partial [Deltaproteobacteria bacterium]|nr:hypothetical protein [Deltaproteobacteria bacterium]